MTATRIDTLGANARPAEMGTHVMGLRSLAIDALARMYRPECGLFAFRVRPATGGVALEGTSRRYTAITLLGLAAEGAQAAATVLAGSDTETALNALVDHLRDESNMGTVALTLWAARETGHQRADEVLTQLRKLDPCAGNHPTVEIAWALSALSAGSPSDDSDLSFAECIADHLLTCYVSASGLFTHWPPGAACSWIRRHVTCFADFVYPIQALARYGALTGSSEALDTARNCCDRMCALQGENGQWWWHFDARTGRVVEYYPVYAVHQDAMAPMAVFALDEACGEHHERAVRKGLEWLRRSEEIEGSLIDPSAGVIWRKVARREPGKLTRGLQALSTRMHPSLRFPGTNVLFRPDSVDYECRPYHLGWLLYAWANSQLDCGNE